MDGSADRWVVGAMGGLGGWFAGWLVPFKFSGDAVDTGVAAMMTICRECGSCRFPPPPGARAPSGGHPMGISNSNADKESPRYIVVH